MEELYISISMVNSCAIVSEYLTCQLHSWVTYTVAGRSYDSYHDFSIPDCIEKSVSSLGFLPSDPARSMVRVYDIFKHLSPTTGGIV